MLQKPPRGWWHVLSNLLPVIILMGGAAHMLTS
jgi:hypothetical protein